MMSKVRLSSGSPSLERMETRQSSSSSSSAAAAASPLPKPSACCRSLFGPVDHRELARELRRHRREQEEASRARWNFDFQRHRPLRGRYQWQALGSQALPDFYSRPPRLQPGTQGGSRPRGGGGEEKEEEEEEEEEDSVPGAQRKRPATDDSFPPNKRANTTEEAISEGSPSASSEEQTPKKSSPRQRPT